MPVPKRSPYSLIQEDLCHDPWKLLVACMCLNCTRRVQVERALPAFFRRWPTPESVMADAASDDARVEMQQVLRSLGFALRRTENIIAMSGQFCDVQPGDPDEVRDLQGVGEYAARSYEIFVLGILGDEEPDDHALTSYWRWRRNVDATTFE